jgi:hypothetical protein
MATNGNELGAKLGLKNLKAQLRKIELVMHANKMAHP